MTSRQKKVHYERGTKGGKSHHSHRSSRDSGVGSSSASDRASLGTAPEHDSPFSSQQIEDQRLNLSAVQEALDAANERIRKLEAANENLNGLLSESNKENRSLKKEKKDLLDQIEDLVVDLDYEKRINRREASPRTGAAAPSGSRRTTPPRREADPRPPRREDERSQGSRGERRTSWKEMPVPLYDRAPPSAPQPPPNPFAPRPSSASYPPTTVSYAPTTVSYAPAPVFGIAPSPAPRSNDPFPNDGRYHPYPI